MEDAIRTASEILGTISVACFLLSLILRGIIKIQKIRAKHRSGQ